MNSFWKNFLIWAGIILFTAIIADIFITNTKKKESVLPEIAYSEFIDKVKKDEVKSVILKYDTAEITTINNTKYKVNIIHYSKMYELLNKKNIHIKIENEIPEEKKGNTLSFLFNIIPTILWVVVLVLILKNLTSGPGKAMGIGKAKTRTLEENKKKITFKDVAGINEAKKDIEEIIEFLKEPDKFEALGARIPKGVLLVGDPGNGKTLLARAVAGEADVPFYPMTGSDFVEMFVGVGASRVRDLFAQAKKNAPCIIFIDEIDAVGGHRAYDFRGGGHQEREQTLNQLLAEMDGFEKNETVIVMAATNRADMLDKALLRPGRFDRQVIVPRPDLKGREEILNLYLKKIKIASDVDARVIARGTPGFSGSELENLINEAALFAARKSKRKVTTEDMEDARDKILMGSERKTLMRTQEELERTAYHEAGHAITNVLLPAADPIHKATIIPRGQSLGMVQSLPENDNVALSKEKFDSEIIITMAGRAAEEIFFGKEKVTTGAASDIKHATQTTRRVITMGGLNDKIGPISYEGYNRDNAFTHFSNEIKLQIDEEVKCTIENAYKKAKEMLLKNKDKTKAIAEALLKYETLTGDEVKLITNGKKIRNDDKESKKEKITKSFLPKTKKS